MAAPAPLPQGRPPGAELAGEIRSLLTTTKTLTEVWVIIGVVVGFISLLQFILSRLAVHLAAEGLGGLVYAVLWVGTDILIFARIDDWRRRTEAGDTASLRDPLLLWGVLGVVFGVLPGLLLLWAYLKVTTRNEPSFPPPVSAAPPAAPIPPPPPYSAPGGANPTAPPPAK